MRWLERLRQKTENPTPKAVPKAPKAPVIAGEIVAVQVWSAILGEAVWVVADDLPRSEWPPDASIYTHQEVKILTQVGPETLAWVQAVKEEFGARVVEGQARQPATAPPPG